MEFFQIPKGKKEKELVGSQLSSENGRLYHLGFLYLKASILQRCSYSAVRVGKDTYRLKFIREGKSFNRTYVLDYPTKKRIKADILTRMKVFCSLLKIEWTENKETAIAIWCLSEEICGLITQCQMERGTIEAFVEGRKVRLRQNQIQSSWVAPQTLIAAECLLDGYSIVERMGQCTIVTDSNGEDHMIDSSGCSCERYLSTGKCDHHAFACSSVKHRTIFHALIHYE